jgi:type IV pilus assembly protein PilB
MLVDSHVATRAAVEAAVVTGRATGRKLGEVLVESGLLGEEDLYRALARLFGLQFSTGHELIACGDPELAAKVPKLFTEHQHVLPIQRAGDAVVVAIADPTKQVPELADVLDARTVEYRLVTPTDLRRITSAFALGQIGPEMVALADQRARGVDLLARHGLDAEHVALFDAILLDAIAERASDIHLEIYGGHVRVRLRVDGDLHDVGHFHLTREQLLGVINVLKVKSNLDIAERRAPQGGRFSVQAAGHGFDLRVQTQPSLHGEHAVVRLLPQDTKLLTIEDLGLSPRVSAAYRRLLDSPSGLVLVVGPTGSGKSTTL